MQMVLVVVVMVTVVLNQRPDLQHQTYVTPNIVGPTASILAVLAAGVTTRSVDIKMLLLTLTNWGDSLGTVLVGAVLSLSEMSGGMRIP